MADERATIYCHDCNRQVMAVRPAPAHFFHLIMTVVTGGLWILIWFLEAIKKGGWRCSYCGRKLE